MPCRNVRIIQLPSRCSIGRLCLFCTVAGVVRAVRIRCAAAPVKELVEEPVKEPVKEWNCGTDTEGRIMDNDNTDHALSGEVTETFSDGTPSGRGELRDGKKTGRWTYFYRSGAVKGVGSHRDGEMDGAWEWWREDGSKMRSGFFARGVQTGVWETWDRTGKIVSSKDLT